MIQAKTLFNFQIKNHTTFPFHPDGNDPLNFQAVSNMQQSTTLNCCVSCVCPVCPSLPFPPLPSPLCCIPLASSIVFHVPHVPGAITISSREFSLAIRRNMPRPGGFQRRRGGTSAGVVLTQMKNHTKGKLIQQNTHTHTHPDREVHTYRQTRREGRARVRAAIVDLMADQLRPNAQQCGQQRGIGAGRAGKGFTHTPPHTQCQDKK